MVDPPLSDHVKKRRGKPSASSNSSATSNETPPQLSRRSSSGGGTEGDEATSGASSSKHHKSSRRHRKNSDENMNLDGAVGESRGHEPKLSDTFQKHSKARRRMTGDTGVGSSASRDSRQSTDSKGSGSGSGDRTAVTTSTGASSTTPSISSAKDKSDRATKRKERRSRRRSNNDDNAAGERTTSTSNIPQPIAEGGRRRSANASTGSGGYSSSDDDAPLFEEGVKSPPTSNPNTFATSFGVSSPDWGAGFGGGATTDTTNATKTTTSSAGFGAFDSGFPSDFGNADTTASFGAAFDATTKPTFSSGGADFMTDDYQPPSFGLPPPPPPKKIYDKSPLEQIPPRQWAAASSAMKTKWLSPKPTRILNQTCLPTPVANPLNGRWIVCRTHPATGDVCLHELDPTFMTNTTPSGTDAAGLSSSLSAAVKQTVSAPVLSVDLQRKVATKYGVSAFAVDSVLTIAVGIHKSHGQARTRVAALIDLLVMDNNEVLRIIAIWQWGYGTANSNHPVATLQSVLSPPSGSDFVYNTESLRIGDSCVFVSGASAKGPCVFLCKPTVRETWSANFVGKETVRIACLALTTFPTLTRPYPYLAISLTDGSVSVWTYEPAMKVSSKSTEAFRRLLYPLCRLEGTKILSRCPATSWDGDGPPVVDSGSKDVGFCTHMEWISPKPALSTLLMLAATFQGGVTMYHVALPVLQSKSSKRANTVEALKKPSPTTQLSQTVSIKPFCLAKFPGPIHHHGKVTWLDLGPHAHPTIAILYNGQGNNVDYGRLIVASSILPMYGVKDTADMAKLSILDTIEWKTGPNDATIPRGLIQCSSTLSSSVVYFADMGIYTVPFVSSLSLLSTMAGKKRNQTLSKPLPLPAVGHSFCSMPFGLNTSGSTWLAGEGNGTKDRHGVFHVFSVLQCERKKAGTSNDANGEPTTLMEWTHPMRRHWLVRTLAGDCKEAQDNQAGSQAVGGAISKEEKDDGGGGSFGGGGGGDEVVTGGAVSNVVCELGGIAPLAGYLPFSIVRSNGTYTAVLFRASDKLTLECEKIAMVEPKEGSSSSFRMVQLIEGRDVVFLPLSDDAAAENAAPKALVLCGKENGGAGSITMYQHKLNPQTKKWWHPGTSYRPILGVPSDDDGDKDDDKSGSFVECRKITLSRFQNKISLLAVGTRVDDGTSCVICGPLEEYEGSEGDDVAWSNLLPNIKEDPVFWFGPGEEVTLVASLPWEQDIRGGVAVATNKRVLILSPQNKMKLLGEMHVSMAPSSLVPVGSFTVAFCSSDNKIRYVSGLQGKFGRGLIATLPKPRFGYCPHLLLAVRPDRLLHFQWHSGTRLVEIGQPSSTFLLPTAITRPALLLEPMVANAISTGGKEVGSQPFLRVIAEKFGRKVTSITHDEGEGIGNFGVGMTPKVFELLSQYGLAEAASWLLTGSVNFDRSANSRMVPSWMPVSAKVHAAMDADTHLQLIANGDQYFSEYVKSPDNNMTSTLPRPADPSAFYCKEYALGALKEGKVLDALKMLDVAGTESSEAMLLQLSLSLQLDPFKDTSKIVGAICQSDSQIGKSSASTASAALAALALEIKSKKVQPGQPATGDFTKRWMKPLAPSLLRGRRTGRIRQRIIGEGAFAKIGSPDRANKGSKLFGSAVNEVKHVWNEGPNREKENLIMLNDIQEWFGRRRPIILGKEGAKSAEDRGASTLADILNQGDDDSFGAENEDDFKDGWVEGVGEGQKAEDKLSAYYRFSEGEDEEGAWHEEGFADLSRFENKAILYGASESAKLEQSTSSVDEGDPGKVKALFDLVFSENGKGQAAGLAIPASRGGSLDVGTFHGPEHDSRQRCTIEFWFWVPEKIGAEMILVRRTFGSSGDDLEKVCTAKDKSSVLWELALLANGEVEMRTIASAKAKTEPPPPKDDDAKGDDDEAEEGPKSSVAFARWNHVCLTFKQESMTTSHVTLFLKGVKKFAKDLSFSPPDFVADDFAGASALDGSLEKSHLVFGLNHPAGYRTTELRVWASERAEDDIKTLMTEYLDCAEIKRKFRVKIKKKGGTAGKIGLAPPGGLAKPGGLAPPGGLSKPGGLAPPGGARAILAPPGGSKPPDAEAKPARKGFLAPPKDARDDTKDEKKVLPPPAGDAAGFGFQADSAKPADATDTAFGSSMFGSFGAEDKTKPDSAPVSFDTGFGDASAFGAAEKAEASAPAGEPEPNMESEMENYDPEMDEMPEISPLWDSAIPLSEQVRSSAAAALIRGPPATRHFGGNRGGLPDYRELERFGVGAISICGSEKTIVWRDDQVPPGLTYPIGASGAIVSDQMDEDGSEFLCCFLAKDKRMVVFELSTRTVVVELQMTTKLNYWRFLPPEAGEDTLCFMLVTPVGGFHWMPLDESPRPRQVWKRGGELQGKKIVCYEEGGTNGLDGPDMLSKVGMLLVTNASTGGRLEAWLVPICGDSQALCASDDVLGACLCRPPDVGYEAWMPLLLFVIESENDLVVCVSAVTETTETSIGLTEVMTDALIELEPYEQFEFQPPTLAMGTWPEVLCCSLGSTIVIIVRRKGLVVAYELADTGLELIAQENVGHYVVDAVMRYSAVEGGAEIVLLMSDSENPRDGRVGTFCFRSAL